MDEQEQEQALETAEPVPPPSVGSLLREAREAKGIVIADAARQLKWGVRQLEALEADDFGKLPGPTFVRGFIRNYAKLLHADPQPILDAYQNTGPRMPAQVIASQDDQISFSEHPKNHPLRYGLILAGALLLAGYALYEWSPLSGDRQAAPVGEATPLPLPQPEAAPAPMPAPAPKLAEPPALPAPALAAPAIPVPRADTGNLPSLALAFTGDSWVEIRDRDGKTIFSQLNPANTQQTVQGNPPFELVIGNAAAVKLNYKGKPVDLTAFTRAEVARIKLD
jgi:cytoskeleton protein RodZ